MVRRWIPALVATMIGSLAYGDVRPTSQTSITWVETYTEFGNGDAIVHLANGGLDTQCAYGFWIRGTDAAAKQTLGQVIAAQASGASVVIWADTSTIWNGSGSAACLVWNVRVYSP